MSRVFLRKKFSNYLGENRAIDDIVVLFISDGPSPSPTPTPSVTPTLTPTPSVTPSLTPTNTPSPTPSITPTNTITPTPTLTPTPSPVVGGYHLQAENSDNILAENGDFIDIEN